jgi:RNA polymerase sigma-70 factor (ECF subfamily)
VGPTTFDEFFAAYHRPLIAQAYALTGDLNEAQDLVQEVMLRVWRHWGRVRRMDIPAAWARRVLMNLAIGRWRERRSHQQLSESTSPIPAPEAGHLDVAKAMRRLPNNQRTAVLLHDIVGMTVAEVAAEMKVPEGSVRGWLSRGRRTLAEALELLPADSPEGKVT